MPPKRSYDDPCGVARALDVVGERWALLVVRELLLGPKRFGALSSGLPGISQNVLSQRLRELQEAGVVRRRTFGPPASSHGYELTERGRELEPVLHALARWGSRIPLGSGGGLSTDALMLALQTTFDTRAVGALRARLELRIGDDCFRAEIGSGRFGISRGSAGQADAILTADAGTLRALVFGDQTIAEAVGRGDLRIDGDRRVAARFIGCFPRPAAVSTAGPAPPAVEPRA
jgi:DNA-binding HxlR family transcriptional regulator/putative sterol carrier protein